ncbi:ribonuclease Z [Apibacter sp.]|uniref:ribonuclease Z n=1 Tax=Apibacter sp. TaxID=2023709 RepID=UPI0025DA9968|nr:ribonuclease Z [Apibacter sp.]MCT6870020.1 ribonuclease Z [Apibacter sp.]
MELTILGFNSAIPTIRTNPTSQLLRCGNENFLIDCGEGTQVQLRKAKVKFTSINNIFISHLHGDHVFGLIGLISSFHLLGRTEPLHIYGPRGIKKLIETQLLLTESINYFEINFIELTSQESELIYEDNKMSVWTIPLNHRIYTNGFLFKEKVKPRKLNMDVINLYPEIQTCDYHNLKLGKDFISEKGEIIKNEFLTLPPKHSFSYAFCSDTKFIPHIISQIKGTDVLYHEATFLDDLKELASKTGHTTAYQAAQIAKGAKVKLLILGHFSNRYTDLSVFKEEAEKVYPNTIIPEELFTLDFNELPLS